MAEERRRQADVAGTIDVRTSSFDELTDVLAQTLVQSVTIMKGAADLIDDRWNELTDDARHELVHMLRRHCDHVADVVDDFRVHPDVVINLRDNA